MSRFRQAGDELVPYSDLKPERFELPQAYEPPQPDILRDVDVAPIGATRRDRANVGYAHLKERR